MYSMLNIIITFHNRRQRRRDRGVIQRERGRVKEADGKRQRGTDRWEQLEKKRQGDRRRRTDIR